jgi:hypothetical protein
VVPRRATDSLYWLAITSLLLQGGWLEPNLVAITKAARPCLAMALATMLSLCSPVGEE